MRDGTFAVRVVAIALSVPAALAATACGSQCDRHPDEAPVNFTAGRVDQSAHVYMSSPDAEHPFVGPWLDFPPGRTYRFEHHLGGYPRDVRVWFAFSPNPVPLPNGTGAASGFVPGAGNQATFQYVDADHVDIRNDTCSDVFIMVRIADPILASSDAGSSDASNGDGAAP